MMTASVLRNAAAAVRYYRESDVQVDGLELPPATWHGIGAEKLGLTGEVTAKAFRQILDGDYGTRLRRDRKDARAGYDFTFSAPKSVSLLAAVGGDQRIIQAVSDAANDAMRAVEDEAAVRSGNRLSDPTGNLCWADFTHATGRPVKGKIDPQLHVHCVAGNFTHTASGWKALEPDPIYKNSAFMTAAFRTSLGFKLRELGYELNVKGGSFEVAGVPQRAINEFSSRTGLIEKVADGIANLTARAKGKLGATTREKKTPPVDWEDLEGQWRLRCKDTEAIQNAVERAKERRLEPQDEKVAAWANRRYAGQPEKKLLTHAMQKNLGDVSLDGLMKESRRQKPKKSLRSRMRAHLTKCITKGIEFDRQRENSIGIGRIGGH